MKLKLLILPALLALSKAAPTEPAPANDDAPAAPAGDVAATQDDYCNYCRIYYDDCMKVSSSSHLED